MKNTMIKREDYKNLKSKSIGFKERAEKAKFSEKEIENLGFQGQIFVEKADSLHGSSFAHFSSFLYYNEDKNLGIKPKSEDVIESRKKVDKVAKKDWNNIDVLQDWDKISAPLRAGYVFIGANASTGAEGVDFEQFENFHNTSSAKIQKYYNCFKSDIEHYIRLNDGSEEMSPNEDYIINHKTKRKEKIKSKEKIASDIKFFKDNIHGSYITDLVKGLPTAYSKDLDKRIKEAAKAIKNDKEYIEEFRAKFANLFVDMLVDELSLLGNITHTLIIMNAATNTFIEDMLNLGNFKEKYKDKSNISIRLCRVNHYSSSTAGFMYQRQLEEIFSRY